MNTKVEVWISGRKLGEFNIDNPALYNLQRIVEKAGYKIDKKKVDENLILWLI